MNGDDRADRRIAQLLRQVASLQTSAATALEELEHLQRSRNAEWGALLNEAWHFLHHFHADADIRERVPGYSEREQRILHDLANRLDPVALNPAALTLLQFADHRHLFFLDRVSGRYEKGTNPNLDSARADGEAYEYRCGLWRRTLTFCALFADAGTLWLRLGDCEVDIRDPAVSLGQTPHGPAARNVVVSQNGRVEASCLYWAPIRSSAKDDLLTYAVGLANNAGVLEETHQRMTAPSGRRPE